MGIQGYHSRFNENSFPQAPPKRNDKLERRKFRKRCSVPKTLFIRSSELCGSVVNYQSNRFYKTPPETFPYFQNIFQATEANDILICIAVFSDVLKSHLVFIKGVKVNSNVYQHILDGYMFAWLTALFRSSYVFIHLIQNLCKRYSRVFFDKLIGAPSNVDINHMDFAAIYLLLESDASCISYKTLSDLKKHSNGSCYNLIEEV